QTVVPSEVVLVLKDCDIRQIEKKYSSWLNLVIIEQKEGFFTHALNLGKKAASGEIVIFTDDDAIAPKGWVKRYIKAHKLYPNIAGISSRDIYVEINTLRIRATPDDSPYVRLYRWFIRPIVSTPQPLLRRYRLGVYVTKDYDIAHGPFIPNRTCYSLPFRGVNMSFKSEYIYDTWFPEHPELIRAPGNEQYFGLQLILKGLDTIYIHDNPVLHTYRFDSLSRTKANEIKRSLRKEEQIMTMLIRKLINTNKIG
ncbi:MAG: glycosyltransferase family A protein, partial [Aquificaceae bacterium]